MLCQFCQQVVNTKKPHQNWAECAELLMAENTRLRKALKVIQIDSALYNKEHAGEQLVRIYKAANDALKN